MALSLLLSACGGPTSRTVDASSSPSDGAPPGDGNVPTESNVTCTDYTRTIVHATGEREVYVSKYAIIGDIGFGEPFRVRGCHRPAPPLSCPNGATCTGTYRPEGQQCFEYSDGSFVDGKLLIYCGAVSTRYAADMSITSMSDSTYESLTLTRL